MDIPVIFRYLKDLAANNNRDWFNAHRDAYESARSEFENLLTAVIARISTFDETIRGIEAKDCTYRIYRDTRFSQDKTPYKIHMGGYINAKGKKSDHCGYYIHLQPGNCLLAGGSYCPPPALLKALRQAVYRRVPSYCGRSRFQPLLPCRRRNIPENCPERLSQEFPLPEIPAMQGIYRQLSLV